ncbi:hypothetical protein G7Y89_g5402 [Cudoniella acicularis]|uniref:Uncharacterized protein n=1 Tax=Cudoniella acicularis TaxID=354080 RepID=A0A8H4W5R7_9HELO|nr:hypothetical protein G7Y89_g5402 [Cudoniella acicularis]
MPCSGKLVCRRGVSPQNIQDIRVERVAAHRASTFEHERRVFWECCESRQSEVEPATNIDAPEDFKDSFGYFPLKSLRYENGNGAKNKIDAYKLWCDIVKIYSRSELSYGSDKIPALSGITKDFEPYFGENVAGLWRRNIEDQLTWSISAKGSRDSKTCAPSWSWTSIKGGEINLDPYSLPDLALPGFKAYLANVSRVCSAPHWYSHETPVGQGALVITGQLIMGKLRCLHNEASAIYSAIEINGEDLGKVAKPALAPARVQDMLSGLLLQPLAMEGYFVRIGTFTLDNGIEDFLCKREQPPVFAASQFQNTQSYRERKKKDEFKRTTTVVATPQNSAASHKILRGLGYRKYHGLSQRELQSLSRPTMHNPAYRAYFSHIMPYFRNFRIQINDIIEDEQQNKIAIWATSTAETDVGAYENEYMLVFYFDESGEKVVRFLEFVDSGNSKERLGRLREYIAEKEKEKEGK